ncbi:MAG: DUF1343 domain-containing protein [Fimbriiglobus sp.]|nr:DUF1343 domain-containing protein [Fimbriiglobus sp.]
MPRLAILALLLCALPLVAADIDRDRLARIDEIVETSIKRGDCPGAVVLIVHNDKVVYRKAFGKRIGETPMTVDTVFDLASVTKPVATATSVMLLIEQGKLRLSEKVAKHWPEFATNGKGDVTIEQCLLHTTGLTADNAIADYADGREKSFAKIANLKLEAPAGTRFKYSDVGFLVLGELVARTSKMPLDEFAKKHIFEPLKMGDTGYLPAEELKTRAAPTGKRQGNPILGEVHDPRAFAVGGVAGHAGLFGTADDLARYCRMLLRGGELDGQRILSPLTVKLFTEGRAVPPYGQRSPGWDVDTSFTAQRGELFPAGEGYGHTGFTGTSLWIDPPSQTAIVILSNRTFINEKVSVTELRRQVGTIVGSALPPSERRNASRPVSPPKSAGELTSRRSPVSTGLDMLEKENFASLKGRTVALVTNHTGRTSSGKSVIDLLHKADGVKLVALFSPEHGIRGELDEKVADGKDEKTGLPVFSLYGERRKPTAEQLKGIDTVIYDIQDIGCRFYTYISTLGLVMEAAKDNGLKVVVLDRPNPIGGVLVEGPVRDEKRESFVAYHDIPVRHGMTAGELATLFNKERGLGVDLMVVKCEGWKRGDMFDRTGLPWRNPSPNMRHLTAAVLYPGIGLLETTNVSVGRGTERPFEWVGAPWIDGKILARELNDLGLAGVRFVPTDRTPTGSVHKDKSCGGVDIIVDDWEQVRPVTLGMHFAATLRKLYPIDWQTKRYDTLLAHKATADAVDTGTPVAEVIKAWEPGLTKFAERRKACLLYE